MKRYHEDLGKRGMSSISNYSMAIKIHALLYLDIRSIYSTKTRLKFNPVRFELSLGFNEASNPDQKKVFPTCFKDILTMYLNFH